MKIILVKKGYFSDKRINELVPYMCEAQWVKNVIMAFEAFCNLNWSSDNVSFKMYQVIRLSGCNVM